MKIRPVFYLVVAAFVFALTTFVLRLEGREIDGSVLLVVAAFTPGFMVFITGVTMTTTAGKSGPKAARLMGVGGIIMFASITLGKLFFG